MSLTFDKVGHWSQVKHKIITEYAKKYSLILSRQSSPKLSHYYIDAFAGPGLLISKASKETIPGSPINALNVNPPFRGYYFIELDPEKSDHLRQMVKDRDDVHLFCGDCNEILLKKVFPRVGYAQYRRALCLLDPYGLQLDWRVIQKAGQMESIDLFLNFPVMDINRNALWKNPERVSQSARERMTAFWGDESWQEIAYEKRLDLFGQAHPQKVDNKAVAEAFKSRLGDVAGFREVEGPLAMRNTKGVIIYYLLFASQKIVAKKIINHIFTTSRRY